MASAAVATGRTLRIETPAVFRPLLYPARYKGAYGGRGSAKSHTFAEMLIEQCILGPSQRGHGVRAVCVREVQRSLEQSVKRLLDDKIKAWDLGASFRVLNTHIETPGGGVIIFQGMQSHTAESMKSLEGYDIAWVEEAQALSQRSLDLLRPTIRVASSELWFTWNPRDQKDPVDVLLRGSDRPPEAVVVRANWSDNPWFPDVLRQEMLWDRTRDPEKYAHVWLGEYVRKSEARVFRNWRIEDFATPEAAPSFLFGADWGFAQDPTVLVRCWLSGRTLYVDAEVYHVGCEIDRTPALFDALGCAACMQSRPCDGTSAGHAMARRWQIVADSARPETISHMRRHGYPRIIPARKGAGSVEEGVAFLQSCDIVVHPRCRHAIDELTCYSYKTDPKTDAVLPILPDFKNHVIDALRYALEPVRQGAAGVGSVSGWGG